MKKCPFCAEDIQDAAIKCKHCGEFLSGRPAAVPAQASEGLKWYHKTTTLVVLFLCVGPFMLPLVWTHPKYSRVTKLAVTLAALVLTYYLTLAFSHSVQSILGYYRELESALADASQ